MFVTAAVSRDNGTGRRQWKPVARSGRSLPRGAALAGRSATHRSASGDALRAGSVGWRPRLRARNGYMSAAPVGDGSPADGVVATTSSTTTAAADVEVEPLSAEAVSRDLVPPEPVMDCEQITQVLPHRFPFLLVDKVLQCMPGKRIVALKNVSYNEPYFQGHFPDYKIMPGVLQLEALAQCAGLLLLQPPISDGKGTFYFASVEGLRWRKPVRPGDTLVMECDALSIRPRFGVGKCRARGFVAGQLVIEADMTFAYGKGSNALAQKSA